MNKCLLSLQEREERSHKNIKLYMYRPTMEAAFVESIGSNYEKLKYILFENLNFKILYLDLNISHKMQEKTRGYTCVQQHVVMKE